MNIGFNLLNSQKDIFGRTLSLISIAVAGLIVGGLASILPLLLTVTMFCGVLGLCIALLRPAWALILFLCGIIFLTDASPHGGLDYFAIADFDIITGMPSMLTTLFLVVTAITVMHFFVIKRKSLAHFPAIPTLYAGILLISFATGIIRNTDRHLMRVDFMDMLFPVICFYVCRELLDNRELISRLMTMMITVAGFKALILSLAYLVGHGWHYDTYRVVTTDSGDLLIFITMVLVALHLLLRGDLRGGQAILYATACLPMLFAIVFSYRRAQWGGFLFSLGLLFLGASKAVRRRIALISILLFFLATCVGVFVVGLNPEAITRIADRLTSVFDPTQSSNVYHALESRQVLLDLSHSPFVGLGLGSHHTPLALYENDLVPTNVVHNTFLYIWMKIGLGGLLFFLVAGGHLLLRAFRTCREHPQEKETGLLLPIAASSGLWLAMFLTGPTPWYFHETAMIAMFSAIAATLIQQTETRSIHSTQSNHENSISQ